MWYKQSDIRLIVVLENDMEELYVSLKHDIRRISRIKTQAKDKNKRKGRDILDAEIPINEI